MANVVEDSDTVIVRTVWLAEVSVLDDALVSVDEGWSPAEELEVTVPARVDDASVDVVWEPTGDE